jgi:hypothetical protein
MKLQDLFPVSVYIPYISENPNLPRWTNWNFRGNGAGRVEANEELACGDHAELSVLLHEHNHMYEHYWYIRHVRFTFFGGGCGRFYVIGGTAAVVMMTTRYDDDDVPVVVVRPA